MASTATDAPTAPGTVEHKRGTVRPDKGDTVAELTRSFSESAAAVLTEYRGLTVKQITDLRVVLGAGTTYAVVKNSLTKIAAREAGLTGLDALLSGPTAVAFVSGDPVAAAKGLRDYARTNPSLIVKGAVMDGRTMTAGEVGKLADLESREVLLAKLAGAMKASLTQAVYLFAAPLAQAARAMGALEAKAQQDPSVLAAGSGTPVPAAEATDEADAGEAPANADEAAVAALADQTLSSAAPTEDGVISSTDTSTDSTSTDSTDSTTA